MNKRHILIIGGTKGIGSVIAQHFAEGGNKVSVIGQTLPESVQKSENNISFYRADITNAEQIQKTIRSVIQKNGKIGSLVFTQRYRGTDDDWSGEINTTLTATKNIIELCKSEFDEKQSKSIVIIGSVLNTLVANDQPLSYHVAKTALLGLVHYYAVHLGSSGIRINSVSPGAVLKDRAKPFYRKHADFHTLLTDTIPLGRMGTPDDIARTVAFLCSPDAGYITGQDIIIDGGLSLLAQESLIWKLSNRKKEKHERK